MEKKRDEAVAELRAALEELEQGEPISHFIGGHGLMSRLFEFRWDEPPVNIDFRLPYARVLSDEEAQEADNVEIGAVIRMALLLLTVDGLKDECLGGMHVNVWADANGQGYSMYDEEGNTVEYGDDWSGLVRRLEAALPESEGGLSVIWP